MGVEKQPTFVRAFMAGVVVAVGISVPLAAVPSVTWALESWKRHAAAMAAFASLDIILVDSVMCMCRVEVR